METIISKNPLTGETIQEVPVTPLEEIPQIIEKAKLAQKKWSELTPKQRANILKPMQFKLLNEMDSFAKRISTETGKPVFEAIAMEVIPVIGLINTYCKRAPKLLKDKPLKLEWAIHRKSYLHYSPVGVVAVIAPWNFPFTIPFGEVFMALLAGNAVILKPSEITPVTGLLIRDLLKNTNIPENLFQLVVGDGTRGSALVSSKGINKVCFTGSVATGKKVMAAAAENLTPVVLELGGKDPMIVMPDADLDFATAAALWGSYCNSGQACASTERIIVHESIHDQFVELFTKKTKLLTFSSKNISGDIGAITFEKQKEVYRSQLAELSTHNSKIFTGGIFNKDQTQLSPAIITNPTSAGGSYPLEGSQIYNEETFGPLVAITKFSTVEEAIEKANKSKYGLLASIISADIPLAKKMAEKIEAGSVLINEVLYTHGLSETPWGGVKESGIGVVHSDEGLLEFAHAKHIQVPRWFSRFLKAPWWFPYTENQNKTFHLFASFLYGKNILVKLINLPGFLFRLLLIYTKDRRL